MPREATIQGEVHASETDKRALVDRGLEGYDAVLVEGRSPTLVVRDLSLGYAAFLAGYVWLMWLQAAVERTRRAAGRTDVRQAAEEAGADYYDRIDADTATVYGMVPGRGRKLLGAALCGLLAACILVGVDRLVIALLSVSLPYLYTTSCIALVKLDGNGRAHHMAETITELAEQRSYDRVAILCGDAHREDLKTALRRREWSVETYGSRHPIRRLFRPPRRVD